MSDILEALRSISTTLLEIKSLLEKQSALIERQVAPKTKKLTEPKNDLFKSYSDYFNKRYGIHPTRNAKINSLLKQIHQRSGEKFDVLMLYYFSISDLYLTQRCHPLEILLKNCEEYLAKMELGYSNKIEMQLNRIDRGEL